MDDRHQAVAAKALEVAVDQFARLDRLRSGRLPACPGQRGLDARREEPERDGDDRPGHQDGAEVARGVAAQPADRADARGHAVTDLSDSGFG